MFRCLTSRLTSIVVLILLFPRVGLGDHPSSPHLFPRKTVAFLRIVDIHQLSGRFQDTALAQLARDDSLRPLVGQFWQAARDALAGIEDRLQTKVEELLTIPQGEIAIGLVDVPAARPAFAVLIDIGNRPDVVRGLLEQGQERLLEGGADFATETIGSTDISIMVTKRGDESRELVICERDAALLLTTSVDVAKQILANWDRDESAKSLAEDDSYAATMRRALSGSDQQLIFYVNPVSFAFAVTRDNFAATAGLAMLPTLGLDGMRGFGGSVTMGQGPFDSLIHAHLLIDAPRAGVLRMLALQRTDVEPEPWVPADVASYTSFHWDLYETLRAFEELFDGLRGEGAAQAMIERRLSAPLDIDFEKDVVAALTGRFIHLKWMEPPLQLTSQASLLAAQLEEPARFHRVFAGIVREFGDYLREHQFGSVSAYTLLRPADENKPRAEDRRRRRGRRRPETTFAIIDDYFLVADRPSFIKKIVETRDFEDSLSRRDACRKVFASVGRQPNGRSAAVVSYYNAEEVYRQRYALINSEKNWTAIARRFPNNRFVAAALQALEDHPLPPFEVLKKYVSAPGGSMISDEKSGIHYASFLLRREP